jgi:hypothetical protein
MRRLMLAAAALIFWTTQAGAGVPSDLWGYYPGQSQDEALAINASRTLEKCKVFENLRSVNRECLKWSQDFLQHSAAVQVLFSNEKTVKRITFDFMNTKQSAPITCAELSAAVAKAALELFGGPAESNASLITWRDGKYKVELRAMCGRVFPNEEVVGGVLGAFELDVKPE